MLPNGVRTVTSFCLSYTKPNGKLALGQNSTKGISDKSNSVAMCMRIQKDAEIECQFPEI